MSAYVYPPITPPGQAPPFAVVTETDHRAWIYITTALGVSLTFLASSIRVFIRSGTKSGLSVDDGVLAIATILAIAQSVLILAAGSYGLGASTSEISFSHKTFVQKLYYSSNLLYVISLGASRSSVALFLRRLTPVTSHIRILDGLLAVEVVWMVAVLLLVALQCDLSHPWDLSHSCVSGWFTRWQVAEALGAVFEAATFAVALWMLVWKLKLPFGKKVVVTTVFGLRLAMMTITITFRLTSFDKTDFLSDMTLHSTAFVCWTQAELNISIIAATIPIAHKFLMSLVTHWGGAGGRSLIQSMYTARSNSDAVKMGTIHSTSTKKTDVMKSLDEQEEIQMRPQDTRYSYGINAGTSSGDQISRLDHAAADSTSLGSDHRKTMMIRKDVSYHVEHGTRWYD